MTTTEYLTSKKITPVIRIVAGSNKAEAFVTMTIEQFEEYGKHCAEKLLPTDEDTPDWIECDFKAGANFVNEKQPYTAQDMEAFAEWTAFMQWIYDHTDECWFQKHSSETITTAQLRELWEQERREK